MWITHVLQLPKVFSKEQLKLVIVTLLEKEHTEVLGETIPEIIEAKIGVVKEGTPVLVAKQSLRETEQQIAERAQALNCGSITSISQVCQTAKKKMKEDLEEREKCDTTISIAGGGQFEGRAFKDICMKASPDFLLDNLRSAVVSAELLAEDFGITVTQESIQKAISEYSLPGRFQVIQHSNEELVILDGAHTAKSAKALVDTLVELYLPRGYSIKFVVAMARDKEMEPFMRELCEAKPTQVLCTTAPFDGNTNRSCTPEQLVRTAKACGLPGIAVHSFKEILQSMEKESSAKEGQKSLVCFTGSFRIVELYLRSKGKIQ